MHRRARRLPARLARRGRARRRPASWRCATARRDRRRSAFRCSSTASSRAEPERRERAFFRRGGLAALDRADARGRAGARPRPGRAAPDAPGRRWSPPARRWRRSTSSSTPPTLEIARGGRGRAARVRRRARRRAGDRRSTSPARAQVSTNIHDPIAVPLAAVIERVRELAAEHGARPVAGEVVGLVPEAALADSPRTCRCAASTPSAHVLERRLSGLEARLALSTLPADGADEEEAAPQSTAAPRAAASTTAAARAAAHPRGGQGAGAPEALEARRQAAASTARPPADLAQRLQARPVRRRDLLPALLARLRPAGRRGASALSVVMLAMYVPMGYYIDRFIYRRRLQPAAGGARGEAAAAR